MHRSVLIRLPFLALLSLAACGGGTSETPSGTLVVKVSTSGVEQDPDGYTLSIGGWGDTAVAINATLRAEVPPDWYYVPDPVEGEVPYHPLTLAGVASNCATTGQYGQVFVHAGETDTLTLQVACTATSGTLAIKVTTTGVAFDPDGYKFTIDGGALTGVGTNATTAAVPIAVGAHTVTLSGVVMNCAPNTAGPYPVDISPAESDTLTLDVSCVWPRVAALVGAPNAGVVVLNPDGTNEQLLLPQTFGNGYADPAWNYAANAVAVDFQPNAGTGVRGVGIVPLDSTTASPVVTDSIMSTLTTKLPRWSPNGSTLIVVRPDSAAGTWHVYSVAASGGPLTSLTPDSLTVMGGDWSPDGTKIAFTAQGSDLKSRLYVINSGGGNLVRITPDSLDQVGTPRWSPLGDKIAFADHVSLWTISPAGGSATKISIPGYQPASPAAWSPLGDEFLIVGFNPVSGGGDLLRIGTNGAIHATLTRVAGAYLNPDWR